MRLLILSIALLFAVNTYSQDFSYSTNYVGFWRTDNNEIVQHEYAPISVIVRILTSEFKIVVRFEDVETYYLVRVLDDGSINYDEDGEYVSHAFYAFDNKDRPCIVSLHDYSLSDNPSNRLELYIKFENANIVRYFYLPAKPLRID